MVFSLKFMVVLMAGRRGVGEGGKRAGGRGYWKGAFDGKFRANGPWLSLIEKTTPDAGK